MGHKVHPYAFRVGRTKDWKSRWFAQKKYSANLAQDIKLREFISERLSRTGLESVEIERNFNTLNIIIKTARPGLVIGRGGGGVEKLKKDIQKMLRKNDSQDANLGVKLDIEEVRDPNTRAVIVANEMAAQIEKRMPYRRVIKQTLDKIMQNREVKGAKIMVKGRLNGAEIARKEWLKQGQVPLSALRADIDYNQATAYTTYGTIGIKVWIYKGEIFS